MQEITPKVYIETTYPGVTLGAIDGPNGLILIDSPIRQEDARAWRSALLNLGGGADKMLIILDGHYDRTVGVRNMECTVVGHTRLPEIYRSRPVTFKAQGSETGAEWEQQSNLGSIRWASPEITFTDQLTIDWDSSPIVLQYRPGPSSAAIWVELEKDKVLFVGDLVTPEQPPFFASADLPLWIEQLNVLLEKKYKNYLLISGRGGLVVREEVRKQLKFLEKAHHRLETLAAKKTRPQEVHLLANSLASSFNTPPEQKEVFRQRLRYGLYHYYVRRYCPEESAALEE